MQRTALRITMSNASLSIHPTAVLHVTVNGDVYALPAGSTLADLITRTGHRADALASAINGEFVPRTARATRMLADGDAVFTFQAITGG